MPLEGDLLDITRSPEFTKFVLSEAGGSVSFCGLNNHCADTWSVVVYQKISTKENVAHLKSSSEIAVSPTMIVISSHNRLGRLKAELCTFGIYTAIRYRL